jgi:Tol biopolymer transport system component
MKNIFHISYHMLRLDMRLPTNLYFVLLFGLSLALSSCDNPVDTNTITETYLHGRAAWSPDGRSIAFSSMAQNQIGIYVTDTLGANTRQIVSGDGVGVSWSPNGAWIVFARAGRLFKVKPSGDSLKQVTDSVGAIRPAWSKDGSMIAYIIRDALGGSATWVYDVGKTTSTMVLPRGDYPSWHPTSGELILMDAQYDAYSGYVAYSFFALTISTASTRIIGSFTAAADCGFSTIRPSATDIVYAIAPPTDYTQIWIYNIAQNVHTRLTVDGGNYPAWNPDGSEIVYTRSQQGDGGLWIMNADGTGKRRLTKPQ